MQDDEITGNDEPNSDELPTETFPSFEVSGDDDSDSSSDSLPASSRQVGVVPANLRNQMAGCVLPIVK